MISLLHDWQDLSGAILGGLLGVIGALIVAGSALARERRVASVMLQRDLLGVTAMINTLTHHRKLTIAQVGAEELVRNLTFFRQPLSPLFEQELAVMSSYDLLLTTQLVGFHEAYAAVDSHIRKIESLDLSHPEVERAKSALPGMLEFADGFAHSALYLLPLQQVGTVRRLARRLRRWLRPDQRDKASQALIKRLRRAAASPGQTPGDLRA